MSKPPETTSSLITACPQIFSRDSSRSRRAMAGSDSKSSPASLMRTATMLHRATNARFSSNSLPSTVGSARSTCKFRIKAANPAAVV